MANKKWSDPSIPIDTVVSNNAYIPLLLTTEPDPAQRNRLIQKTNLFTQINSFINIPSAQITDFSSACTTIANTQITAAISALSLGTMATQNSNNVSITGGSATSLQDVSINRNSNVNSTFYSATNISPTNNQFNYLDAISPNSASDLKVFSRDVVSIILREAGEEISSRSFQVIIGGILTTIATINGGGLNVDGAINVTNKSLTRTNLELGSAATANITKSTHTTNWSGIWASPQGGDIVYTLIDDVVTLNFPQIVATANTASVFTNTVALPANLRPSVNKNWITTIVNNGVNSIGTITINTGGTITITNTQAYANFTGSGNSGLNATSISYKI